MFIRPALIADIPAIDALVRAAYPTLLAADYDAALLAIAVPLMAQTKPVLMRDQTYFVMQEASNIVGVAGWTQTFPGSDKIVAGYGHIRKLVIDDRYLRRGIARQLMDHIHKSAAQAGMTKMHVLSTRTAIPFYAAMGYIGGHEIDIPLGRSGVTFPAIEMCRQL
jgi:N-acetylglutamate synthase-like GNAT family acetyltransferase